MNSEIDEIKQAIVSLPEEQKFALASWLSQQMEHPSPSQLESQALEGLRSGSAREPTVDYWEKKHRRLTERLGDPR